MSGGADRESEKNRIEKATTTEEPEVRWTPEQEQVISLRDRSLLVSAAAGSGKTAVLVQRIISMITDPERPMDVDELLVVTFTNAAAAEMRERVLAAIEAAVETDPSDTHLQRQVSLIHNAQITTIDSFCKHVLQNHFYKIGLEPGFRIADEGELKLLREDVCDRVLERFYAERDPAFLRFADSYASAKSDQKIRDMVLRLYDFSQSYPWPQEWLESCAGQYEADTAEALEEKKWMQDFLAYLQIRVEEMVGRYRKLYELTLDTDGPQHYEAVVRDDLRQLEDLLRTVEGEEASVRGEGIGQKGSRLARWQEALDAIKFKTLPGGGKYTGSEEKRTAVKTARDQIKAQIKGFREKYFSAETDVQLERMKKTGAMVQTLVAVTEAFSADFSAEKAGKNILDFSDLEHMALRILVDPVTKQPTETAAEYRAHFREIMIDEYQDSNYVQEALLTAVSGIPEEHENLFMVGDVKQSIYRFRLARPELFMGKYESFSVDDSKTQRIDLHKNFRSRGEVVDVVNDIFARIMGRDLGNVEYDADAALYMGGNFAEYEDPDCCRPECLLVEENPAERSRKVTEARAVAQRIREMIRNGEIPGKQYKDVVILLRSLSGWAETFQSVFEQEGVPLLVPSQTGYFSAQEVQGILAMLRVLDNPRQDIPLVTVMRSPIGDFSGEELAAIRLYDEKLPFFSCVEKIGKSNVSGRHGEGSDEEERASVPGSGKNWAEIYLDLQKKTEDFWLMTESFRRRVPYTPIHSLIQQIYAETGYRDYVTAMAAGEQRRANLDMLLEKAIAYEQTSYHGLFHFIRYIDRLMKYDVDYGEAETVSEQENAVRLMTIHKSKGLEFPIVVLAGMGKQFNMQDERDRMIFHPEYGIGLKYFDAERRTKQDTLIRQVFAIETKKENMGEELRILYVALTRAKEKLILAGMEPKKDLLSGRRMEEPFEKLEFTQRLDASCYWDWVLPALKSSGSSCRICRSGLEKRVESEQRKQESILLEKERVCEELRSIDPVIYEKTAARLSWEYPYEESGVLKQKVSVSEIKHRAMEEAGALTEEDGGESLFPEEIPVPYIPKFVQAQEENLGALRGTAAHRFLECLDFASIPDSFAGSERNAAGWKAANAWLEAQAAGYVASGRIRKEEAALLILHQMARFLTSGLAGRMREAAACGRLTKEQPFVMSLPAKQVWNGVNSEETVLVQGIIDVFWEEEDGIVLLDYKTDRVERAQELVQRYEAQMRLYAEALNRRFAGKRVKETLIYSFRLDEVIVV
ncbi:MAG: helicase-exonuclease AddAB subunit AddA [Clostridiales bacterium]|nr:helicase-exonuclease AddAB subunit AddA [Clostridiales bacterium]